MASGDSIFSMLLLRNRLFLLFSTFHSPCAVELHIWYSATVLSVAEVLYLYKNILPFQRVNAIRESWNRSLSVLGGCRTLQVFLPCRASHLVVLWMGIRPGSWRGWCSHGSVRGILCLRRRFSTRPRRKGERCVLSGLSDSAITADRRSGYRTACLR